MKKLFLVIMGVLFFTGYLQAQPAGSDQWSVWGGSDGNDFEIYYAHRQGNTWSASQRLNADNSVDDIAPSVAVDAKGRVAVAWVRCLDDRREIYYSQWDGLKWSSEEIVGLPSDFKFSQPSLAWDEAGRLWVVATGVKEGGQDDIFWAKRAESGWTPWLRLNEEDSSPDLDPSILAVGDKTWVVWLSFDGSLYHLVTKFWDGKKWGDEQDLTSLKETLGESPSLSVKEGKPSVVFYYQGKTFQSQWDGQNWTSPVSTLVPIEATFVDVWKNQGVTQVQFSWFANLDNRGSLIVLLDIDSNQTQSKTLASRIEAFFKISGNQAWAAVSANVYTAFGDSITGGIGNNGYPPHLEDRLVLAYGPSTVINRGVGGEKSNEGLSRVNSVLNEDNPEFFLLMEGTNEVVTRSPESIAFNLFAMIDQAVGHGAKPIISTITPRPKGGDGGARHTNDLIRAGAGSRGVALVDNYTAIVAQPTPVFDSFFSDGLHLTEPGNDFVAQQWFNTIQSIKGGGTKTASSKSGGCGTIQMQNPDRWNMNLEPALFLILALIIFRRVRKISKQ